MTKFEFSKFCNGFKGFLRRWTAVRQSTAILPMLLQQEYVMTANKGANKGRLITTHLKGCM